MMLVDKRLTVAPFFVLLQLPENSRSGYKVGTLTTTDPDNVGGTTRQSFSYSLIDSLQGLFVLNGSNVLVRELCNLCLERKKK